MSVSPALFQHGNMWGALHLTSSPLVWSYQVPVKFHPRTSLPKTCRLVLMSRRDNSASSAATLVFMLKGDVDVSFPLQQVHVEAPLYQLVAHEFIVTNPFPAGEQGTNTRGDCSGKGCTCVS